MSTSSSSSHTTTATTPIFIRIIAFSLLSFAVFFLFKYFSADPTTTSGHQHLSFFTSTETTTPFAPPPTQPQLRPRTSPGEATVLERTGIINEFGVMAADFVVGKFDEGLIQSVVVNANSSNEKEGRESDVREVIKVEKFRVCDESMSDFIPCLHNVEAVSRFNFSEKYECPENGKGLDCLVPWPKGYKLHVPWPKSRDEVWFNNVPHAHLVQDKDGKHVVSRKDDKIIFSGEGPQFIRGADQYLDQISKMAPEIAFGNHTRVALDIGSGIANFGAQLMDRNVTTLSIAPKDQNQIQLALERGIPAMVASFGTHRLPYPSQGFDLIHCSRCRVNWTLHDGILLLEANRLLRAGGYFVWEAQPVYNYEGKLVEQWREMEDLTINLCWELVSKEGYIAIWQKPLNNSCYLNRDPDVRPPICDSDDNPDDIWYVDVTSCITRLPENGYGANTMNWPARLHSPPDRLYSIKMDADKSRKELYKADSKYWNDIVTGYIGAFHVNDINIRNVMDMKAGYGGFAAAFLDFQVNSWVMNVVPVSGTNTLPVIYDRGLIGVMHDWCEPFDTYPRTYDLLNAAGLFSVEERRCNITNIMLEMDRILRPGGRAYIRDTTAVIPDLQEIAKAMGWVTFLFDSGEGPHSNWKLLTGEKRL